MASTEKLGSKPDEPAKETLADREEEDSDFEDLDGMLFYLPIIGF
jgi:hypothetical protein